MTPERISKYRSQVPEVVVAYPVLGTVLSELLDIAEREAKLREDIVIVANALAAMLATRISREDGLITDIHKDLRAALESKGGES